MTTEYERLLSEMMEEKKAKLSVARSSGGKEKQVDELVSEIRHIQQELDHYDRGLKLFRSKSVPKVGRWGRPEPSEGQHSDEAASRSS